MKKYDLHIHTKYSSCSNLEPKDILRVAKAKGLNGIAITDHDTIKGALEVQELNKDKDFEVIVGEEISTDLGHVQAFYVKEEIKPGKFKDVIKEIRKQDGLVVIPHPNEIGFVRHSNINLEEIKDLIDAVEGINGRVTLKYLNLKTQKQAKKLNITLTAGSDAHFKEGIGNCYTMFEKDLRTAFKEKKTKIGGSNKDSNIRKIKSLILQIFAWVIPTK
jgi:predicted metal-dependent phosphoesterase TrpH